MFKKIGKDLTWLGVLDKDLRVFDIIMESPYGTSYNAYLYEGSEAIALVDTVKVRFFEAYLAELKKFDISKIKYLIVNHTEPDHAGGIALLLEHFPELEIVGSAVAISFLKEIVNKPFKFKIVRDNAELSLGDKTLRFIMAPNLHWPDSMFTYAIEDQYLFTCDTFGAHYALDALMYSEVDDLAAYQDAYQYYYECILKPYDSFLLKAMDKIKDLDIKLIACGHGPVIDKDVDKFIANYQAQAQKVCNVRPLIIIPYVSSYGYTAKLKDAIIEGILERGDFDVRAFNLETADKNEVIALINRCDAILFGTPTFLGAALPPVFELTTHLNPVMHSHIQVSAFGSYGWSGEGVGQIVEHCKQLKMQTVEGLRVKFNPSAEDLELAKTYGSEFVDPIIYKEINRCK